MLTIPRLRTHQSGFIQAYHKNEDILHAELSAGLLAPQAVTSPKYLYDALGSKLFEAICELPEYYPTRTEAAIFDEYAADIAASVGRGTTMIDLGAGNCAKAAKLFPALQPKQYVPIDISVDFLRDAVSQLRQRFPYITMTGVGLDFSSTLNLPDAVNDDNRLFFYPGSSIGNFTPVQALAFLRRLRAACRREGRPDGGLLIGVDLIKDKTILDAAYDDALGVTAAFNLNLLRHLNTLLDADFDVRQWQHRAFFNTQQNRIEMHLEAKCPLVVSWAGAQRGFEAGESIHTENSYKYTRESFTQLLHQAGFETAKTWTDDRGWFMVCHARAV
ncbi:MAG: L-histidine N(alpha)-methyltransferase [Burkholderiaceae bacterium]